MSKEGGKMAIDPERKCIRNSRHQGTLAVVGLIIMVVMLGALALFTGSVARAQDTAAAAAQAEG